MVEKILIFPSAPWSRLVLHFYCRHRHHLHAIHQVVSHAYLFWHGVIKSAPVFKLGLRHIRGDGMNIRFWLDLWLSTLPLAHKYLTLIEMAVDQTYYVASNTISSNWAPAFISLLSHDNDSHLASLIQSLTQQTNIDHSDCISWTIHSLAYSR